MAHGEFQCTSNIGTPGPSSHLSNPHTWAGPSSRLVHPYTWNILKCGSSLHLEDAQNWAIYTPGSYSHLSNPHTWAILTPGHTWVNLTPGPSSQLGHPHTWVILTPGPSLHLRHPHTLYLHCTGLLGGSVESVDSKQEGALTRETLGWVSELLWRGLGQLPKRCCQ